MAIASQMWIHGHSIRVEYPNRMDAIQRKGGFCRLKGWRGTNNWFHMAVPTTVFFDNIRLHIASAFIRYRTSGAKITKVNIYDGANKIASNEDLEFQNDSFVVESFLVPEEPIIKWGLGISFKVQFGSRLGRIAEDKAENLGPGFDRKRHSDVIDVCSAGGDFTV